MSWADNPGIRNAEGLCERMNANGCRLHVAAILRNIGITDAGKVWRDDGEFILQLLNQRTPHSRGLRIAMQENDGGTLTRGEVLKLFPFDFCKARLCGFACLLSAQLMFSKEAMNLRGSECLTLHAIWTLVCEHSKTRI